MHTLIPLSKISDGGTHGSGKTRVFPNIKEHQVIVHHTVYSSHITHRERLGSLVSSIHKYHVDCWNGS